MRKIVRCGAVGANCADANACSASTDSTKTTGNDGEFWCINGGVIGGSAGGWPCARVPTGFPEITAKRVTLALPQQTRKEDMQATARSGALTVALSAVSPIRARARDVAVLYRRSLSDRESLLVIPGWSSVWGAVPTASSCLCVNGGTTAAHLDVHVPPAEAVTPAAKGDHCHTAKDCLGTRDSARRWRMAILPEHGACGTTGACQCKDCARVHEGTHCQTPKLCTASSDPDMASGANGIFHCINGGTIGGVTGSCTCTAM